MNKKQVAFVHEYIKDYNATQAGIRAGYSAKTAYSIAQRLLKQVEIQEAIQELHKEAIGPTEKIIKDNINLWRSIMLDTEAREADRLKASELIGKYAGMFTDKVEHSGGFNHSVQVKHDLSKLTIEELEQLEKLTARTIQD